MASDGLPHPLKPSNLRFVNAQAIAPVMASMIACLIITQALEPPLRRRSEARGRDHPRRHTRHRLLRRRPQRNHFLCRIIPHLCHNQSHHHRPRRRHHHRRRRPRRRPRRLVPGVPEDTLIGLPFIVTLLFFGIDLTSINSSPLRHEALVPTARGERPIFAPRGTRLARANLVPSRRLGPARCGRRPISAFPRRRPSKSAPCRRRSQSASLRFTHL
jgi:hypothetical protein